MGDLNTTPRTWTAAEIVTAAMLNAEVRDALTQLQAPWVDYTAAWTAATTNPAIGNGTIDASYHRVGKTVSFLVKVTMGSTTTYGSGQWRIALPFAAAMTRWRVPADLNVSGGSYLVSGIASNTAYLALLAPSTTAGNADRSVSPTVPAAWSAGDSFTVAGTYETA